MDEELARDRAVGALIGLAVGDAVGTTLEFKSPGTFEPITDMVGGGPFRLAPGAWTDDTSMAMCLAESILDTGGLDPADQLRRYVAWRREGYWSSTDKCFDIGGTTSNALSRFVRDGSVTDAVVDQESAANGSLMRLAAVPIRWHRELGEAAEKSGESSRTTHPARRPVDACRVYGSMIAALIQGRDIDEVLDPGFWSLGDLDPEIEAVIRGSWRDKEPPAIKGTGFVVAALEAALWAVAGATDFRDAVLRAANLGNDADTTAAIAGQLAGARWGKSGIPQSWLEKTVEADRIATIGGLLFDAATEAEVGSWRHDDLQHAYWLEPGRILAGEYPISTDPDRATAKINVLIDNGIRTFVDLTRPEDPLPPYEELLAFAAEQRGLDARWISRPIPDMGVVDSAGYDDIVGTILEGTGRGGVFFHCWGGIGRTATVAGCLLVDSGLTGDEALTRIGELRASTRKSHMSAPQTEEQREVILNRTRPT